MAPPRAYTRDALHRKVQEFIDAVEAGTIDIPDDYRFCTFLGVSPDTVDNWYKMKDKYLGYSDELKILTNYREHWYLQQAKDSKTSAFTIFCLKQPKNGGYTDKDVKSIEPVKLEVSINGVKGAFE